MIFVLLCLVTWALLTSLLSQVKDYLPNTPDSLPYLEEVENDEVDDGYEDQGEDELESAGEDCIPDNIKI